MTTPASPHLPSLLLPLAAWARRGAAACHDRQALGLLCLAGVLAAALPGLVGLIALAAVAVVAASWLAAERVIKMIDGIAICRLPAIRVRLAARPDPSSHTSSPPLRPPRLAA